MDVSSLENLFLHTSSSDNVHVLQSVGTFSVTATQRLTQHNTNGCLVTVNPNGAAIPLKYFVSGYGTAAEPTSENSRWSARARQLMDALGVRAQYSFCHDQAPPLRRRMPDATARVGVYLSSHVEFKAAAFAVHSLLAHWGLWDGGRVVDGRDLAMLRERVVGLPHRQLNLVIGVCRHPCWPCRRFVQQVVEATGASLRLEVMPQVDVVEMRKSSLKALPRGEVAGLGGNDNDEDEDHNGDDGNDDDDNDEGDEMDQDETSPDDQISTEHAATATKDTTTAADDDDDDNASVVITGWTTLHETPLLPSPPASAHKKYRVFEVDERLLTPPPKPQDATILVNPYASPI